MSNYDKKYQIEVDLFGEPYPEFVAFVKEHALQGGCAVDIGCGQGRDTLMLARHGYHVTGVDTSHVGVVQMLAKAQTEKLPVNGVVADFYTWDIKEHYDAIVLDSILHFEKTDKTKELKLLDKLTACLNENGYLFIFVHKSTKKEKELHSWLARKQTILRLVQDGYCDAIYEEKSSRFKTEFQMYMFILQRIAR